MTVEREWVTDREAARLAGVSRSTWRTLSAEGRAPAGVRIGRSRRWSLAEVRAWLEAGAPALASWNAMREGVSQ